MSTEFNVVVIGGGLVGSLSAIYFSKRGYNVKLFEKRQERNANGRSINLTLSTRGIEALEGVGIQEEIFSSLIPLKGRYIHTLDGIDSRHPYGIFGQSINSVSRKLINEKLLSIAEQSPLVQLNFSHSLEHYDFDSGKLTIIKDKNETLILDADLVIGADGSYSKTRALLNRKIRMNYSQEYINHLYVELHVPAKNGDYQMDSDHLHIWPRESFMMIACPNLDCSFTVTLFMPREKFEAIKKPKELLTFFEQTFPDALPLIGHDLLVQDYFSNPKSSLISIKCDPYHYKKAVIVGDAAHAMVPFYGQGMNCGMEDVLILNDIFNKHTNGVPTEHELSLILQEYTLTRKVDAHAICDLAQQNYIELRSGVMNPKYLLRKKFESTLHKWFPSYIIPLYTMVSFSRLPYSKAIEQNNKQTKLFEYYLQTRFGAQALGVVGSGCIAYLLIKKLFQ
ncbi:hypothetical protein HDV01_003710 [Terramyces sp. JEL0728]|nr:hypothetical protein HDV01_003710 [Terramyces sp. JEL0728]